MQHTIILLILLIAACTGSQVQQKERMDASTKAESTEKLEDSISDNLQVRGVLTSDGQGMRRKHPLKWVPRAKPASIPLSDGALLLRITLVGAKPILIPFDAYEEDDSSPGKKLFGGFTLEVSVDRRSVPSRVDVNRKDGKTLIVWGPEEIPVREHP